MYGFRSSTHRTNRYFITCCPGAYCPEKRAFTTRGALNRHLVTARCQKHQRRLQALMDAETQSVQYEPTKCTKKVDIENQQALLPLVDRSLYKTTYPDPNATSLSLPTFQMHPHARFTLRELQNGAPECAFPTVATTRTITGAPPKLPASAFGREWLNFRCSTSRHPPLRTMRHLCDDAGSRGTCTQMRVLSKDDDDNGYTPYQRLIVPRRQVLHTDNADFGQNARENLDRVHFTTTNGSDDLDEDLRDSLRQLSLEDLEELVMEFRPDLAAYLRSSMPIGEIRELIVRCLCMRNHYYGERDVTSGQCTTVLKARLSARKIDINDPGRAHESASPGEASESLKKNETGETQAQKARLATLATGKGHVKQHISVNSESDTFSAVAPGDMQQQGSSVKTRAFHESPNNPQYEAVQLTELAESTGSDQITRAAVACSSRRTDAVESHWSGKHSLARSTSWHFPDARPQVHPSPQRQKVSCTLSVGKKQTSLSLSYSLECTLERSITATPDRVSRCCQTVLDAPFSKRDFFDHIGILKTLLAKNSCSKPTAGGCRGRHGRRTRQCRWRKSRQRRSIVTTARLQSRRVLGIPLSDEYVEEPPQMSGTLALGALSGTIIIERRGAGAGGRSVHRVVVGLKKYRYTGKQGSALTIYQTRPSKTKVLECFHGFKEK